MNKKISLKIFKEELQKIFPLLEELGVMVYKNKDVTINPM
jgi:hypothetical protein